ncbi:MAG: hypothetical protein LBV12_08110 [Puniceicoccales bacterium]|jgi:(p)ppGpp synthase/HD superfamily hydrolase|nr:hypothetical protein [Puniceicoccales bacterium]
MQESAPSSQLVQRAEEIARHAHRGQFRRDGVTPYIVHPEAVAVRVKGDALAEATAWLHDTLEDTSLTVEQLRAHDIPEQVIAAVALLTKQENSDYEQYLVRLKANPLAKKVKIADLLANLSDHPSDRQIVKYAKGLLVLLG